MTPGRLAPQIPPAPRRSSDGRRPPIARAWHALHPKSPLRPDDHPMDGRAPQSYVHGMPCTLNPPCAARRISAPTIIYGRNAHYSITPAEATRYHDSTRRYSRYRHRYDYVFGRYAVGRYPVLGAVPTLC